MNRNLSGVLKSVTKPGRYSGGEYGQIIKDKESVNMRFAFCFPDTYEIGMSNLGMRILYGLLNNIEDVWCERVYLPWVDMYAKMKELELPLAACESGDDIKDFDMLGFTLQYEMCYTNVLAAMSLSKIPVYSADRTEEHPIVIGGGPCTYNAEPVADFFDLFFIGEAEEILPMLCRLYIDMKNAGEFTKKEFLLCAARTLPGIYVPSFYDVSYKADGTIDAIKPLYEGVPKRVTKVIVEDLDTVYFPDKFVMPYIETVHDRIMLEVYRGCIRGCRFCQAGMVYRPVREKSAAVLDEQAKCLFENTGYDEISLTSLSISDYTELESLTDSLLCWTSDNMINISLPSLRADSFTKELMEKVASVRSTTLTFAPEAGTQRLRDVINKNVTQEDLVRAVNVACDAGKTAVKLYFMQGLPTETKEDLDGIVKLAHTVLEVFYANPNRNRAKRPQVTISVACFIPKPFTPFQWEAQDSLETLMEKQKYIESKITDKRIRYNYHNAKVSRIEGVLARGDRRLSCVIAEAHLQGFLYDAWDECFDYDRWISVFEKCGVDPAFYANRKFGDEEILPWDIIDCGVSKQFLLDEKNRAYFEKVTPNCREGCSACGADSLGGERRCCP